MRDPKSIDISMVSETVKISLGRENYTADAAFEFFNYGKTLLVTVGFPTTGHPFGGGLDNFHTWVNGQEISVEEMPGVIEIDGKEYSPDKVSEEDKDDIEPIVWLVKKVTFPASQKTVTRVKYNASLRNLVCRH